MILPIHWMFLVVIEANQLQIPSRCPIPILPLRRNTYATTTGYNRSPMLSPRLDLPGFWLGNETRRLAIADLIWYSAGE